MGSRWCPGSSDETKSRQSEIEEHVYLVLYGLQPTLTYLIYSIQYVWNIIITIWPQFTQQTNKTNKQKIIDTDNSLAVTRW